MAWVPKATGPIKSRIHTYPLNENESCPVQGKYKSQLNNNDKIIIQIQNTGLCTDVDGRVLPLSRTVRALVQPAILFYNSKKWIEKKWEISKTSPQRLL